MLLIESDVGDILQSKLNEKYITCINKHLYKIIHMNTFHYRGLSAVWLNATTGELELVEVEGGDRSVNNHNNVNPSYLAVHPNGKVV